MAQEFLAWRLTASHARWVDVGCGTGALTRAIIATQAPLTVLGIDSTADDLAFARQQLSDPHVSFQRGDAERLPLLDQESDVAVSGLVLNFVAHPEQAVNEWHRVARHQGVVAAYVCDYANGMQLMRYFWNAVGTLHATDQALDEGRRFPLCRPDKLRELWQQAGLCDIASVAIDVPTIFQDFDEYWGPFLSGQGPAPKGSGKSHGERN